MSEAQGAVFFLFESCGCLWEIAASFDLVVSAPRNDDGTDLLVVAFEHQ